MLHDRSCANPNLQLKFSLKARFCQFLRSCSCDRQVGFEEPLTEETFADGELLMRDGRPGKSCVDHQSLVQSTR